MQILTIDVVFQSCPIFFLGSCTDLLDDKIEDPDLPLNDDHLDDDVDGPAFVETDAVEDF